MKYFKKVENGYIVLIGTNCGGEEITEQEYNRIMQVITNKPTATNNRDYKLKETLDWEMYEIFVEDVDEELTPDEALKIITGGAV